MIGNSPLTVDENSNIIIHSEIFKGTVGLWELLTQKNVDTTLTTKKILYLETLFTYRTDAAKTHLTTGIWYSDTCKVLGVADPRAAGEVNTTMRLTLGTI